MFTALLVDDDPPLRQAMARCFRQRGFQCELAANGEHAQKLLADRCFDVVVTDLKMPEMNGHRLAVELLRGPQPPVVIIVTGVAEQKIESDLRARGVDEFFYKPADYADLALKAQALIERRRKLRPSSRPSAEDDSEETPPLPAAERPRAREAVRSDIDKAIEAPDASLKPASCSTALSKDHSLQPSGSTTQIDTEMQTKDASLAIQPAVAILTVLRDRYGVEPTEPKPEKITATFASTTARDYSVWQFIIIFAAGVSLGWFLAMFSR